MNRSIRFGVSIGGVVIQDILDSFSVVSLIFNVNGWCDFCWEQ